jgi:hypothetical protein
MAGGPPLRFLQRWGARARTSWDFDLVSNTPLSLHIVRRRLRGFGPGPTLRKPRRMGHPKMQTECAFSELYFHPERWATRPLVRVFVPPIPTRSRPLPPRRLRSGEDYSTPSPPDARTGPA